MRNFNENNFVFLVDHGLDFVILQSLVKPFENESFLLVHDPSPRNVRCCNGGKELPIENYETN